VPEHVLGTVDGIEIVLRALQCTDDGITVDLYGRANALTERLDAAFADWEQVAIDGADARPYSMPL
jgi:secreted protein with Ig-like and vWFA domain